MKPVDPEPMRENDALVAQSHTRLRQVVVVDVDWGRHRPGKQPTLDSVVDYNVWVVGLRPAELATKLVLAKRLTDAWNGWSPNHDFAG